VDSLEARMKEKYRVGSVNTLARVQTPEDEVGSPLAYKNMQYVSLAGLDIEEIKEEDKQVFKRESADLS